MKYFHTKCNYCLQSDIEKANQEVILVVCDSVPIKFELLAMTTCSIPIKLLKYYTYARIN